MKIPSHQKNVQRLVVAISIVVFVAFTLVVSDYKGYFSLSVGLEGINLSVDGRQP